MCTSRHSHLMGCRGKLWKNYFIQEWGEQEVKFIIIIDININFFFILFIIILQLFYSQKDYGMNTIQNVKIMNIH